MRDCFYAAKMTNSPRDKIANSPGKIANSPNKMAKQKEMKLNRGKEEINVAFEKEKAEGEMTWKVKGEEKKEEEESEVIWEAVNFALEQLNLDSSEESAEIANEMEKKEELTRKNSEKERVIPKLQPGRSRGSNTKLKSGSNHLNLIQIKRSPMQNAKMGKQIPKLVPLARSSIVRQEESKSKPGANHLNLIQVWLNLTQPRQKPP